MPEYRTDGGKRSIRMNMRRFKIRGEKDGPYFWVNIFENHSDMHKWYLKYLKKTHGWNGGEFGDGSSSLDFSAMVMPYSKAGLEDDDVVIQTDIGNVIINKEAIGVGVISHEMVHCALWHDRLINGNYNAEYGIHSCEAEERLAYLVGNYTKNLVSKLYKIGVFT